MENQIYRVELSDKRTLEFYIVDSNELEPYRPIKMLGIIAYKGKSQSDADLELEALDSLIEYLTRCRNTIANYNAKPIEP